MNLLTSKRTLLNVVLAAVCLALSACENADVKVTKSKQDGWVTCATKAGGFSFDLPGSLKSTEIKTQEVQGFLIKTHFFLAEPDHFTAFTATFTDFPASITNVPINVLLDGGEKSALEGDSRLIFSTNSVYEGCAARRLLMEQPKHAFKINVLMVMVQHRLIQLTTAAKDTNDISKDVEYFFQSLRTKIK